MELTVHSSLKNRKNGELLLLPFFKHKKEVVKGGDFEDALVNWHLPVKLKDFTAAEGEVLFLYPEAGKEPRIALLGLGEAASMTIETLRRSYANAAKAINQKKARDINLVVPHPSKLSESDLLRGISEGLLLANYVFDALKHDQLKELATARIQKIAFIGASRASASVLKKSYILSQGVAAARDLVNGNADHVTPQYLGAFAKGIATDFSTVTCAVLGKREIEKAKLGLLLAVNQGSSRDPALIELKYRGQPKSKEHILLIGKGITYDTGGLNIKPTGSMETMKCDMAGAAAVLATIQVAAALELPLNVTALVPATENGIDGNSFKPGDVYQSYSGKTVEIGNTDAEGRLVLADAIAYGLKNHAPSMIIDVATLTGAVDIALGPEAAGLFSNDESLAKKLIAASEDSFERVWRLPLFQEYRDALKSDVADIKNIGGRSAGSITAAIFLQEFIGKKEKSIPWAHLDIAATAYLLEARRYHPKGATGFGVRLLISFLASLS